MTDRFFPTDGWVIVRAEWVAAAEEPEPRERFDAHGESSLAVEPGEWVFQDGTLIVTNHSVGGWLITDAGQVVAATADRVGLAPYAPVESAVEMLLGPEDAALNFGEVLAAARLHAELGSA